MSETRSELDDCTHRLDFHAIFYADEDFFHNALVIPIGFVVSSAHHFP